MDGSSCAAHHTSGCVASEAVMAFPFAGETAENTCASPAGVLLRAQGVFMCP